jgi:hypothetical protein
MTADGTKALPLWVLLQEFHGASYITSLDLSSAFLQLPLKELLDNGQLSSFKVKSANLRLFRMGLRTVYQHSLGLWKMF